MRNKAWSELTPGEKAERIREAIDAGAGSAAEVASRLRTSRNAIIGICTRNNIRLPGRQPQRDGTHGSASKPIRVRKPRTDPIAAKPSRAKPVTLPVPERAPEPEFISEGVPFIDLKAGDCKWPLWDRLPLDASQAKHCGKHAEEGSPWCEYHKRRATHQLTRSA